MFPRIDERFRRRISWSVLVLALLSFVCLGLAEQGTRGTAMGSPPSAPLPFARHLVMGLDLQHLSSLDAIQWLENADVENVAFIAIPIDADVVAAFGQDDVQEMAASALDRLVAAGNNAPLAACLRRPAAVDDAERVALVAIETMIERYPGAIAYVSACDPGADPVWQQDIARAMAQINQWVAPTTEALVPVASGVPIASVSVASFEQLRENLATANLGAGYALARIPVTAPVEQADVLACQEAIAESAHLALVMLQPDRDLDPDAVVPALASAPLQGNFLPEGFTNAAAPFIIREGEWQESTVGTVEYLRTSEEQSTLVFDFIGTDVYLLGIRSPEGGQVSAWIDPQVTGQPTQPDVLIDFSASQARDSVRPLFTGLPAARHRVYVVAQNNEETQVTLSGFVVMSRPTPAWTGLLAASTMLLIGTAALAERCHASIVAIRRYARPRGADSERRHPRGFKRQ
jgi:hypothetical protein